ncbi:hypothetical protein AAFF_G00421310 [Aldrovandia affinis]|uniref:Uncharacterized protein n=1 Tax=Aldrovandia affinis TaxID=143900 RepID=A0AAD7SA15_9TELE|nr:hypothetical protein AAFF_G00421310 [Aldrovandia affinis]
MPPAGEQWPPFLQLRSKRGDEGLRDPAANQRAASPPTTRSCSVAGGFLEKRLHPPPPCQSGTFLTHRVRTLNGELFACRGRCWNTSKNPDLNSRR